MKYQSIFQEANDGAMERYELVIERLERILSDNTVPEEYQEYFAETTKFLLYLNSLSALQQQGTLFDADMTEWEHRNEMLYGSVKPEDYACCYGNPTYAVEQFGTEVGQLLCFLYAELQAGIGYVYEGRLFAFVMLCELYVQIYNCFEAEGQPDIKEAKTIIYWFFHDYSEVFATWQVEEMINPDYDFCTDIVMNADLNDLSYLYRYGLPVSENELKIAAYLNTMSQEEIQAMADTYTEGYRIGFEMTGKDLSKKKTVQIRYNIGFERMIRAAIQNFAKLDLQPTIAKDVLSSFFGRAIKRGAYSTSVNKQYDFDHREDRAYYFNKMFVERRLEVLRTVFEQNKKLASLHGGPAVLEVFGEEPFAPVNKEEAVHYSDKQQQLNVYNASMSGQITNEYIKGEERSFTIIAYPVPAIGDKFEEIFAKTVEINTLDYTTYQRMQQKLIDVLDQAEYVHIKGKGDNQTDLKVSIYPLTDLEKQTAFENCVADVNIPVGEVFTSPVLKGTTGTLHVTEVFLNELKYENLKIVFEDGMITAYDCSNFATEAENQKYVKDNVLMHHDTLPMGEFAIGTNTTAYRMGMDYQIMDKLPILIAEKCGPHFAVGDTCYSHAEDTSVYNPDGKEIVARDNEVSLLRKEDMSKAYYNCHTDITIPYHELDTITVFTRDGGQIQVIVDGRFVVEGTEELNVPLDEM